MVTNFLIFSLAANFKAVTIILIPTSFGTILANALIFLLIGGGIGLFVLHIGLHGIKLHESNIYQNLYLH